MFSNRLGDHTHKVDVHHAEHYEPNRQQSHCWISTLVSHTWTPSSWENTFQIIQEGPHKCIKDWRQQTFGDKIGDPWGSWTANLEPLLLFRVTVTKWEALPFHWRRAFTPSLWLCFTHSFYYQLSGSLQSILSGRRKRTNSWENSD